MNKNFLHNELEISKLARYEGKTEAEDTCQWKYIEPASWEVGYWQTGCERYIESNEPCIERVWQYCPFCGKERQVNDEDPKRT